MKFLVLVAVILAIAWILRNNRKGDSSGGAKAQRNQPGAPQDMVQCPVCSVHLPRIDALAGPDGRLYCCSEHLARGG